MSGLIAWVPMFHEEQVPFAPGVAVDGPFEVEIDEEYLRWRSRGRTR